jgi:hypothetical protein
MKEKRIEYKIEEKLNIPCYGERKRVRKEEL